MIGETSELARLTQYMPKRTSRPTLPNMSIPTLVVSVAQGNHSLRKRVHIGVRDLERSDDPYHVSTVGVGTYSQSTR